MAPYWYVSGFLLLISLFELALKKDERTNHILTWLLCFAAILLIVFGEYAALAPAWMTSSTGASLRTLFDV